MPFYTSYKKKGTRNRYVSVEFSRQRDALRRARDYAIIYGRSEVEHVKWNKDKKTGRSVTIAKFGRKLK